jgi:Stress responsive A/B Barrel Domain
MLRRLPVVAVLALLGLMAGDRALDPVRAADKDTKADQAGFVHAVILYMKSDAPAGEMEAAIKDAHELLSQIPSVREIRCGPRSEKDTPRFASKDYQLGLLVLFDDADGLKTYLDHPLHAKFVERHEKNFDKVVVYDFTDQKK